MILKNFSVLQKFNLNFLTPMQSVVKFQKVERWARIPVKSTSCNNGLILPNAYTASIPKNCKVNVSSGIRFLNPLSHVAFIFGVLPSTDNKNLHIHQSFVALNDELKVKITNLSDDTVEIPPFIRLTDFAFLRISSGNPNIVESLDSTERGERGFGSTGLK